MQNTFSFIFSLFVFGFLLFSVSCAIYIFFFEGTIQHIKEDWKYRLPYRLDTMNFEGASCLAYMLLCFVYYGLKSLVLLVVSAGIIVVKFIVWDFWLLLFSCIKR